MPTLATCFRTTCRGIAVGALLASVNAGAEESTASEREPGYLTFYLDNDLFGDSDRSYTNGVRLSWISDERPAGALGAVGRPIQRLAAPGGLFPAVGTAEEEPAFAYGFSLTQRMYTPDDPRSETQPLGERRYAGWLGLGFSVHARTAMTVNSAELIIGTTGPRSQAEPVQDFIHELTDSPEFQGWSEQIPNEITLDLAMTQKRRLVFGDTPSRGLAVDGFTEWGVRLGTFQTLARAGGLLRVGLNLPAEYSDPRLSATAYSHRYFTGARTRRGPWSVYGLIGGNADARFFDATLDGPLFGDFETGNERELLVGSAFAGFALRYRMVELSYVHSWPTRTFTAQRGSRDFGSVALRVTL